MDQLDRLGWAIQATVVVNEVWIGLRVNDADLWPHLLERLPPGAQIVTADTAFVDIMLSAVHGGEKSPRRRPFHFGYLNFKRVSRSTNPIMMLDELGAALQNRLSVPGY